MNEQQIDAERYRWDLSGLYADIDDAALMADVEQTEKSAVEFYELYRGKLAEKLGEAVAAYERLSALAEKPLTYLYLLQTLNTSEPRVKAKIAQLQQRMAETSAKYLTFFELEIMDLPQDVLDALIVSDERVSRYKPWIEKVRLFMPNRLSEPVESAITVRSPFTSGAWAEFFEELESDLRFQLLGEEKTLTQMLDILSNSQDESLRAAALQQIHEGLGGAFHKYSAQTLYMVAGLSAVERRDRKYRHPMEVRNKSNMVTDETVEILHKTVMGLGSELAKRYYRLKARMLKKDVLEWSDRNAPLPFADNSTISFDRALTITLEAYRSFSPTLASVIEESFVRGKAIDAPAVPGKRSGAFNLSMVLPDGRVLSFTLLNYLGSNRDVMTLAHELGHGVHGMLAGREQGRLMFHAPIAYCETASVFGEMTAFKFLRERLRENADVTSNLALLAGKIEDALNTVVRQIGFSNFERRLHGMDAKYLTWGEPVKMSPEELDSVWMQTLQELYGQEGEIFHYTNANRLWTYVGHFHNPFYVYGYAFGELVTQSLYAQQEQLGEKFEPLYLELLKAGGTKNIVELLRPFGLDPTHPEFWERGLRAGLGRWIAEAESLFDSI